MSKASDHTNLDLAGKQETAQEDLHEFSIFPNPTTDYLNLLVEVPQAGPLSVELFDLQGRSVYRMDRQRIERGHHLITLRELRLVAGQYVVRVKGKGLERSEQVVVQE